MEEMPPIPLSRYHYDLPTDRIAQHPLEQRAQSKLLVYQAGKIQHDRFFEIRSYLPPQSLLVLNDTKVIAARLHFQKPTGAIIEIFLLTPVAPTQVVAQMMLLSEPCTWHCMIGNKKRWKENLVQSLWIDGQEVKITASLTDPTQNHVTLSWDSDHSFASIVTHLGALPLPPYIKRDLDPEDQNRYQTIYSVQEGAVAAPTAGLHFTQEVLTGFQDQIKIDHLTLHVGAGTFQPITSTDDVLQHKMHAEQMVVTKSNVQNLLQSLQAQDPIIPVGTTSLRTLESLYWYGVKLIDDPEASFHIPKLYPYQTHPSVTPSHAMQCILESMEQKAIDTLFGETEIFIFPGYDFKVCRGLITNFHMPETTLILLVAAMVGEDWRSIYQDALDHDYRFLSYGDSSLLLP